MMMSIIFELFKIIAMRVRLQVYIFELCPFSFIDFDSGEGLQGAIFPKYLLL